MARNLKIVAWNANGLKGRANELLFFVADLDIDVVLVCETHLVPQQAFKLPNFETYRTDRPARPHGRNPGGGTAILVHRRLVHRGCVTATGDLETTGVILQVGGGELLLVAAYLPPTVAFDGRTLEAVLSSPGPVFVAGDFNAKHQSWNSRSANAKGRALRNLLDRLGNIMTVAPIDPTFTPPNHLHRPDVIDFALTKDFPFEVDVSSVNDLSSDHSPVLFVAEVTPTTRLPREQAAFRTDWTRYHQLVSERLPQPREPRSSAELDDQITELHGILSLSVSESTVPVVTRRDRKKLPRHIREEISRRNALRRRWRRSRHPDDRRQLNHQNRRIKSLVDDFRAAEWDQYLSTLNVAGGSVWRAAKQIRGSKAAVGPLHGQQGLVYSAEEKAEAFADTMFDQFQTNADVYDEQQEVAVEHFMETYFEEPPADALEPLTLQEVRTAVRALKPRKAPGLDRIGSKALQSAPETICMCLLTMFNAAFRLCHFPAAWKSAKIILIPKPGKDHLFPQNHRPISLLPVISKLFERLFLSRLSPLLTDFIRPEQFGFRRGHSTTQQLIRVLNDLVDNHNLNLCSVAVLLDVSKAFDKVWHEGLLLKLSNSPLPSAAVHLLKSYLEGRTFQTCVDGQLSTVRQVEAGVPQGSVLGPVLYLVYTNDMPTVAGISISLYADDALLLCRSTRPALAANRMQTQMDALSPWLQRWRIKVNADKSNAICFRKRRRMPRAIPPDVELDGEPIPWSPTVKYLGVTLDSGLRFHHHVSRKVNEAKNILGLMWPLLRSGSPLPARTKVTLFLLIVRSCMMYASEAWWVLASRTNRKRLEAIQSKALRWMLRQPWFVRNSTIRDSAGIPTLAMFSRIKSERLFQKAAESQFEHIRRLCVRNDIAEDWRPRPVAILDDPP